MDTEEKVEQLGAVTEQLKRDKDNLHALMDPGTPLEEAAERETTMEDFATQLEEMEQEAKRVTDATTQFWGSVVKDAQLEQLNMQLQEAGGKLETLNTLLKAMPLVVHVMKASGLKALQQQVAK